MPRLCTNRVERVSLRTFFRNQLCMCLLLWKGTLQVCSGTSTRRWANLGSKTFCSPCGPTLRPTMAACRLGKAREFSRRATELAKKNGAKETAALWLAYAALHEAEVGNAREASQQAHEALSIAPGRDVRVLAGMALARAGYDSEANKLADGLNEGFPLDTTVQ